MKNFFQLFPRLIVISLDYPMNVDLFKFISRLIWLIKVLLYEYGIGISVL